MVLHNPNNWHWVNKDVSAWTRQWLEENLTKVKAQAGDVEARISKVQSMDGDVDVSQRKGKVITIFDVKLVLEYTGRQQQCKAFNLVQTIIANRPVGSAPDEAEVSGTITVPEVAHDTDEDEYVVCPYSRLPCLIERANEPCLTVDSSTSTSFPIPLPSSQ
jgi:activator of HSP90 ATPase